MNDIGYTFFILGIIFSVMIFCFNIYREIENKKTIYMIINALISALFIGIGLYFIINGM